MNRLSGLDALRGIAALVVVIGHAMNSVTKDDVAGRFYIAVDVFFVLSGYVMARTYEHRMPSPPRFVAIRLKRLWPTMAVGGLLGAASVAFDPPPHFAALALAGLFLVPTSFVAQVFPLNTPTWSIVSELFANALHGLGVFRIRPLLLLLCGVWLNLSTYAAFHAIGAGPFRDDFLGSLPRAAGSYCIGISLFRLSGKLPNMPFWPIYGLFLLLFIPGYGGPLDLVLVLVVPTVTVICGLAPQQALPLQVLGAASFPLYAVHEPIQRIVQLAGGGLVLSVVVPVVLVCSYAAASNPARVRQAWFAS